MKVDMQKILCAFCKIERQVYIKKTVGWTNVGLSFFAASLMMFVIWRGFDPRVVILFVVFLVLSEIFLRMRWRMKLTCPHCGFDPVLYKVNREEAAKRVKAHLDELRASGQYLLKQKNPFQNLPVVKVKSDSSRALAPES